MTANTVKLDLEGMKALGAELRKAKNARVRVGIFNDKAGRFDILTSTKTQDELNNPTLGLIHEFGTKGSDTHAALPARSFLRMPLTLELPKEIDKVGRAVWRAIVLKKGIRVALGDLGITATNIVQRAFATSGFGQWAANAAATIRRKGSSKPLIDSDQLRKSINYQVTGVKP